jgi:hypothetical protein
VSAQRASLVGASTLTALQASLWALQGYWLTFAGAAILTLALLVSAWVPKSKFSLLFARAFTLPSRAGEPERRYRFRSATIWLSVLLGCVGTGMWLDALNASVPGLVPILFWLLGIGAFMLAVQSLSHGLFPDETNALAVAALPNKSLERPRGR